MNRGQAAEAGQSNQFSKSWSRIATLGNRIDVKLLRQIIENTLGPGGLEHQPGRYERSALTIEPRARTPARLRCSPRQQRRRRTARQSPTICVEVQTSLPSNIAAGAPVWIRTSVFSLRRRAPNPVEPRELWRPEAESNRRERGCSASPSHSVIWSIWRPLAGSNRGPSGSEPDALPAELRGSKARRCHRA